MKVKYLLPVLLLMVVAQGSNVMTAAVNQKPLMSKLPTPGKIVKEYYNEILDFKELELSNGVRVMIKSTDSSNDKIAMSARQRGGSSLYGEKDWANCEMFNAVIQASGLGGFSNTELKQALEGKEVSVGHFMETYIDDISGFSAVKDLETLFQLTYLQFTAITKDEEGYKTVLDNTVARLKQENEEDHTATGVFLDTIVSVLYDHNWRYKSFKAEDIAQLNYDRVLEIAKERTANAANYTFVFTGPFGEATIRPLIERYIASLPASKGVRPNWVNVTTYPQRDIFCHFKTKMETPQTQINIRWINTQIPYSDENEIKARMLSDILKRNQRAMMPEEAGAAHPVGGNHQHRAEGDMPFTEVHTFVPVKPEFADEVIRILNDEMVKACEHIDADTFEYVKKGELEHYENWPAEKNSFYWMSVISGYAFRGEDYSITPEQIIKAQTPETISAFARQLLATGSRIEIVMSPAE